MSASVTLRCRACDAKRAVDARDGLCARCYKDFKAWAKSVDIEPRKEPNQAVIDFARPEVAVAFDQWLEQGR